MRAWRWFSRRPAALVEMKIGVGIWDPKPNPMTGRKNVDDHEFVVAAVDLSALAEVTKWPKYL